MMVLVLLAGLALLGAAVTLIARGLLDDTGSAETVDQIGAYGFSGTAGSGTAAEEGPGLRERLDQLASRIGTWMAAHFSRVRDRDLRSRLITAGMYTTQPARVHGYQLILSVTGVVVWIWIGGLASVGALWLVAGIVAIALAGWFLPIAYIDHEGRQRKDRIEKDLPDLIDLLVVTLEAGLSFPQSMRTAATKLRDPLAQELRLTLQEQNMGLTLVEALDNFADRVDTPGVRSLARSISQGETLGVSMGQIMRNLAVEMRKKRKAYAEEKAQKAPVKMLFPLIFLIFPAIFIVLLLPAMLRITDVLG